MRILIVTQYFWPENFRINDLVFELVRRGHDVTVLTGIPNYPDGLVFSEYLNDPDKFTDFEGSDVLRVPMMARGRGGLSLLLNYLTFAVSATIVGAWKLRGRKYDAIFAYEPSPITVGLPAVVMRFLKRAPLAFWVQDLWPETLQAVGIIKSPVFISLVGKFVEFIYKRCDLILAQSKSFIPQIRKYAPPDSLVLYFPNWCDTVSNSEKSRPAPEVPTKHGSLNIMFAGNIGDAQDCPSILSAAQILKGNSIVQWLIVGDGRMANWVAYEVKRRKLQEEVKLLGRFPYERMPSFFHHADALLVSLKDEPIYSMTIPSKLQAYLATGIPIIAMLNGEGSDIVRESGAGLTCRAGDYKALAAAVVQLSKMTAEERGEMGRKGLLQSEREFNCETLVSRLEEWIVQMVASSARPPNFWSHS